MSKDIIPVELLARTILVLRGQKVLLDADLARLYGVTTKVSESGGEAQRRSVSRTTSCSSSRRKRRKL